VAPKVAPSALPRLGPRPCGLAGSIPAAGGGIGLGFQIIWQLMPCAYPPNQSQILHGKLPRADILSKIFKKAGKGSHQSGYCFFSMLKHPQPS